MTDGIARIIAILDAASPIEPPDLSRESKIEKPAKASKGSKRKKISDAAPPSEKHMGSDSAADPPSRGSGDETADEPAKPKAFGYSVESLNKEFALVLMASKAVVFFEQPAAPIENRKRVLSLDAFRAWFANRFTQRSKADGAIETVSWAKAWLTSHDRRSYRGIEFFPDPNDAPGLDGYLNLWSGFDYKPAEKPDPMRFKTYRDHLFNNVCAGDDDLFVWVFGFLAHIVQRPRERIGTALVLRGLWGAGKTKVGEVVGKLFPEHWYLVDDPRYVTGNFNVHMATCLLLQADEAVWAGDKAAEGRLKGLITSPIQQIEAKGVDPIRLPNYVRLIMTSNEDWVVPAGKGERRFAVFDIDPRCAENHGYFAEMDRELENGGFEHLLGALLAFDLDSVDLRKVPRTKALLEQKIRSFDSIDGWWYERLFNGAPTRHHTQWQREVACSSLFDDYIGTSEKIGVKRKQEATVLGIRLAKLVPGVKRQKRYVEVHNQHGEPISKRTWCYILPDLATCRDAFAQSVKQPVDWPEDDSPDPAVREIDEVNR